MDRCYSGSSLQTIKNTIVTISCWMKSGLGRNFGGFVADYGANSTFVFWNLTTGAITSTLFSNTTLINVSSSDSDTNGWRRYSITIKFSGASVGIQVYPIQVHSSDTGLSPGGSYVGDVTKGIYACAAQFSYGLGPQEYIRTTTLAKVNDTPAGPRSNGAQGRVVDRRPALPSYARADSNAFNPRSIQGLTAWFDGDVGITNVNEHVSNWADPLRNVNFPQTVAGDRPAIDRKSTRLNSSHHSISYAV